MSIVNNNVEYSENNIEHRTDNYIGIWIYFLYLVFLMFHYRRQCLHLLSTSMGTMLQ
jgi:hypothetical protein